MKEKVKKGTKKFFSSIRVLIIALMLIIIVLMVLCYHLMNTSKTYMFNGKNDYVEINNGVISLNYDVNLLEGSDISYINKKDVLVSKYKIGYYVETDGEFKEIAVSSGEEEDGLSLKGLVEEMLNFNVTEPRVNKYFFSNNKIKSLKDGLYFRIDATTVKGGEINNEVKLDLSKISRK